MGPLTLRERHRALKLLLVRWGDWMEQHKDDASLPAYSAFTATYGGDQPGGHKILCAEMERAVWLLNRHITRLPAKYSDMLLVWYAANMKGSGGFWTEEEKARRLGCSVRTLRVRVFRARGALYREIYGKTGQSCNPYARFLQACGAVSAPNASPSIDLASA